MKIRIRDRILVCLAGIVLIAVSVGIVAQLLCGIPVTDQIMTFVAGLDGIVRVAVVSLVVLVLLLVGLYCFLMLFRHGKGKRGFVTQETEHGDVNIALKAMEKMVARCVEHHPEMKLSVVNIDPVKNAVIVFVKITLSSGVSIPLAIGALQREIKQYVTACSGVDVRDVRVQVETNNEKAPNCPYTVPELLLPGEAYAATGENEVEVDERPAHQRIFAHQEQPVTGPVPAPAVPEAPAAKQPEEPAVVEQPAAEAVPEIPEAVEEPAAEPVVEEIPMVAENPVAEDIPAETAAVEEPVPAEEPAAESVAEEAVVPAEEKAEEKVEEKVEDEAEKKPAEVAADDDKPDPREPIMKMPLFGKKKNKNRGNRA